MKTHPDWTHAAAMTDTMRTLLANRLNELGLSLREAAARSVVNGEQLVSHSTLSQINTGVHGGRFDADTLRGIALALDLPLTQVREVAGLSRRAGTEFRLPKKAERLSEAERRIILRLMDDLLKMHGDNGDD